MKISVVIPAYNRPSLLQEAINSVVSQSYANWELIVVDDGSNPPLSMSEVKTLLGNKGVFLRHDSSRGVARAKNAGLKKATGEIITILDDDDLLAEGSLEEIHNAFAEHANLDCLFLGVDPFGPYAKNPAVNRAKAMKKMVLHQFHCDFLLAAGQSSFSKISKAL